MSGAEFEAFASALAEGAAPRLLPQPQLQRVAVLGGGPEARVLACLCLAGGASVTLFSAYGREMEPLRGAGGITLRGAGPVGTFAVDGTGGPSIRLSGELDSAVRDADLIFLTGPVLKQRTYAMVLAEHVADGQILVLAPGRSLGALEAAWLLRAAGCTADFALVETQGPPYWIRESGSVLHLTRAAPAPAAALPSDRTDAVAGVSRYLPDLLPVQTVVHGGFADGSGLVEIPALLLGGPLALPGGPELPPGAVPLEERSNFRALIGPRHASVIEALAAERRQVASRWGVRDLPDTEAWIERVAGSAFGEAGGRPVPGAEEAVRLARCAVIGSLIPLLSAAETAALDAPVTRAFATLAQAALGGGLINAGRRLDTIGLNAGDLDNARRAMDALARGDR